MCIGGGGVPESEEAIRVRSEKARVAVSGVASCARCDTTSSKDPTGRLSSTAPPIIASFTKLGRNDIPPVQNETRLAVSCVLLLVRL